ncbi:MAG: S-layer homology domain-containing protein, partial [Clostridiales bacterium]|nr:S-layer homology domain-containing protein [Clostridiales bacterium]
FELTVSTAADADIRIVRYRDKAEMAAGANTRALALLAQDYFDKNSATVDGRQVVGGYETLMITAVDSATLGSASRVVTVVPDLTPPTLIVDNLAGDARAIATTDGNFTVQGRTQPGLAASLLNAEAPARATADDEGRFSLAGALPQGSDGQIAVSVMGASGLTASLTLKVEQVGAASFTALELTPAGPLSMAQGDTLALTVLGVKADGSKISLSPDSLTFAATGSASVDAGGLLTAAGTGEGTVAAKLGALQSNTLRIQAHAADGSGDDSGNGDGSGNGDNSGNGDGSGNGGAPGPNGGAGGSAAIQPSGGAGAGAAAHGYIITTPDGKPAVTGADGTITLPGGGTIKTPEGLTVTAPAGTTIDKAGLISIPSGKEAGIGLPGSDARIGVSGGATVSRAGLTSVPASGSAKIATAGGTIIAAPGGTTVALDGTVTPPRRAAASITLPSGFALKLREGAAVILDENAPLGYRAVFENPFADVKAGDWFFDDVGFAYAHGLFAGTGAAAFSPNAPMTRGMAVTVLGRLHGIGASGFAGSAFGDVDAAAYYAAYVEWAREAGIVNGVGGNSFAPDAPVSRQDLAAILLRYAEHKSLKLPTARSYAAFGDDADIAAYAREAVEALCEAGVISGRPASSIASGSEHQLSPQEGNMFDPKGTATRAEVAAMLRRLILVFD